MALPVEEFVAWAERLADLDWPISGEDFPEVAAEMGWRPGGSSARFITGIGEQSEIAIFRTEPQGMVKEIGFSLTGFLDDEDSRIIINDYFVTYVTAGKEAFGKPDKMVPGEMKEAWWRRSNDAVITLITSSFGVALKVYSPQGVEYM